MAYPMQDWEPVVFRKPAPKPNDKEAMKQAMRAGKGIETLKKLGQGVSEQVHRARKLETDIAVGATEEAPALAPLLVLSLPMRQELVKKRTEAKLTQIQLAQRLNIRQDVIQSLECGKVIQDASILPRINRILGTSLKFERK